MNKNPLPSLRPDLHSGVTAEKCCLSRGNNYDAPDEAGCKIGTADLLYMYVVQQVGGLHKWGPQALQDAICWAWRGSSRAGGEQSGMQTGPSTAAASQAQRSHIRNSSPHAVRH